MTLLDCIRQRSDRHKLAVTCRTVNSRTSTQCNGVMDDYNVAQLSVASIACTSRQLAGHPDHRLPVASYELCHHASPTDAEIFSFPTIS